MTRWCKQSKQHRDGGEHYAQSPRRPCEQGCDTAAHPISSSTLFPCPFRHNPTLQHYRLLSVTANVTGRTSVQSVFGSWGGEIDRSPHPRSSKLVATQHVRKFLAAVEDEALLIPTGCYEYGLVSYISC